MGHAPGDWRVEKEATCAEKGRRTSVCSTCGEIVREDIPTVEHTEGEWTVTKKATMGSSGPVAGEKSLKCSVCGEVLKTESYTLTAEEIEAEFKGSCAQYTYEEVFRNPDNYKGKNAVFRGEVIQVLEEDGEYTLRVNVTEGRYIWEDTILVSYTAEPGASRILEDDIVTLYGTMKGVYTYESVMGADITVPLMLAEYIEY